MPERRKLQRKDFSYYMRLINEDTKELVGHLTDISTGGFKLDSQSAIPINKDFRLRLDLVGGVSEKPAIVFLARSRWCKVDPIDPVVYNVGFQIINIAPSDIEILNRVVQTYGTEKRKRLGPF